jgi:hypothetical protein
LKSKSFNAVVLVAAAVLGFVGNVIACGPFFPNNLLGSGDHAILQAPVADFERELDRMNLVNATARAVPLEVGQRYSDQATEIEMNDLAAALKRQKISSEQSTVIMQTHLAERMKLNAFVATQKAWNLLSDGLEVDSYQAMLRTNLPPVFPAIAVTPGLPREFALYFQGVIVWHKQDGWRCREAWENILALPPTERHYKSTWAAYMLGKNFESETNDWADTEATNRFEQVCSLAKSGFVDSLGLAVASLGSEAKINLRHKNYERAIELYLQQFADGDDSAMLSLRFTAAQAVADTNSTTAELVKLAQNQRTRRVITAYCISRNPYIDPHEAETDAGAKQFFDRTTAWLEAVESANVKDVESASQLALAAYQAGQMDIAQRWVDRAKGEPVAQWLQAKLLMRSGKIEEASKLLAKLSRKFPLELPGTNTATTKFMDNLSVNINEYYPDEIAIGRQALGELGALHLARREYTEALDALLRSGYWEDSAYVAERVLTLDELTTYVDRNWPANRSKKGIAQNPFERPTDTVSDVGLEIRYLLARRLARETTGDKALNYFPTNYTQNYVAFTKALRDGRNESLPQAERAKSLFTAAVIARTNGMELFGSELAPDWAIYGGDFDFGLSSSDRATNALTAKINIASTNEIERLSSHQTVPEKRFHYRYQAADLAWQAAELMPDNSDETARVLCEAGSWLKYRDPKAADIFYKALVRRCRKTAIGSQADRMRWFPVVDSDGNPEPWPIPAKTTSTGN